MTRKLTVLLAFAGVMLASNFALALPFTMTPDPVDLSVVGGTGTASITLSGGDASLDELLYSMSGSTVVGLRYRIKLRYDGTDIASSALGTTSGMGNIDHQLLLVSGQVEEVQLQWTATASTFSADMGVTLQATPVSGEVIMRPINQNVSERDLVPVSYSQPSSGSNGGAPVPEPTAALTFGTGFTLIGLLRRGGRRA